MQTTKYRETLNWYLDHLGMIVSDFLYYPGRRDRGPVMSFIRCDRGQTPADHHTLAMALGPSNRYVHSAYQVSDIDAMGAGGRYLAELGYHRSWGIGRHILGSQIFDYWRDPDGFLVEHFSDGDMFDCHARAGLGAVHRLGALPVGTAYHQRLPGIAVAISASRCRRPGIDWYPGRHGNQRTAQANRDHRVAASGPAEVEDLLLEASQESEISSPRRHHRGRRGDR